MKTLAQRHGNTADHIYDIYLDDAGDFAFNEGRSAYGDILAAAMRTLEGEMQLDTDRGIPYQRTVWESVTKENVWEIYVRRTITAYPFVVRIESLNVSIENGNLHYTLVVETTDGTVEITE